MIGKAVVEALPEVAGQGFVDLLHTVYHSQNPFVGRATPVSLHREGEAVQPKFVDFIYQPLFGADADLAGIFVQGHDVSDHKRGEALRTAHNHVLELAIQDKPLEETLAALVALVEDWSQTGVLGSILLLDEDGKHLRHGAAPSLPTAYNDAIDGIAIGSEVGSCGTAAFTKEPVFVSDITTDPLWADFRDLALDHNLRACWSVPILAGSGTVLGTFAMYHHEPREPTEQDLALVQVVTRTAALIINRKQAEEQRKRFERHQQLLVGELNHRVKNTLAIVQSLTHQSFNSSVPPQEAIRRFEGRLQALASAHNLLTQRNWDDASIEDVAVAALAPFCPAGRRTIAGPNVNVPPQTAVSLVLALHELATNAVKYGALSNDHGRVFVRWTISGETLELIWSEEGGPKVVPPATRGFGTRMIERTLAAEFGGTVTLQFAPEGVRCTVVAPLPRAAAEITEA